VAGQVTETEHYLALVVLHPLAGVVTTSHTSEAVEHASFYPDYIYHEDRFTTLKLPYNTKYRSEPYTQQYIQTCCRSGLCGLCPTPIK
jgi:hypothetical protein